MSSPGSRPAWLAGVALGCGLLIGCSAGSPDPAPSGGATSAGASAGATATPSASGRSGRPGPASPTASPSSISEPTTTNTLPPPPEPSKPAASTAGTLTSRSMPRPKGWPGGWHTVARKGGAEEGFEGNGTWVHARDPRYAATDAITIGCAEVTRDDFTDPASALEGNYENADDEPGVGLALQFRTAQQAADYFRLYQAQVRSCRDPNVMAATILPSSRGLIDRRTYPDGEWTEMARLSGTRLVLLLLTDTGHKIGTSDAEAILAAFPG